MNVIQLLIGASLISFSAVFVKLVHTPPTVTAFYRMLTGGVILLGMALVRRESFWEGRKPLLYASLCGVFFTLDLSFWHYSILTIGPGLATVIANFQVFFLMLAGIIVFRERATTRFIVSVFMAMAGLYLLCGISWGALGAGYRTGVLFSMVSALSYALYILVLQRSQKGGEGLSHSAGLAIISLMAAALLGIESLALGQDFTVPDAQSGAALFGYGLVSQVLGWSFISRGLPKVRASLAGLILLLQPALAMVWDIAFFGRPVTGVETTGLAVVLAAIYLGGTARRDRKE